MEIYFVAQSLMPKTRLVNIRRVGIFVQLIFYDAGKR